MGERELVDQGEGFGGALELRQVARALDQRKATVAERFRIGLPAGRWDNAVALAPIASVGMRTFFKRRRSLGPA